MPTPHATHFVQYDEPSATSRRSQKAVCGEWTRPQDVVTARADVTCTRCLQWLAEYEEMAF